MLRPRGAEAIRDGRSIAGCVTGSAPGPNRLTTHVHADATIGEVHRPSDSDSDHVQWCATVRRSTRAAGAPGATRAG